MKNIELDQSGLSPLMMLVAIGGSLLSAALYQSLSTHQMGASLANDFSTEQEFKRFINAAFLYSSNEKTSFLAFLNSSGLATLSPSPQATENLTSFFPYSSGGQASSLKLIAGESYYGYKIVTMKLEVITEEDQLPDYIGFPEIDPDLLVHQRPVRFIMTAKRTNSGGPSQTIELKKTLVADTLTQNGLQLILRTHGGVRNLDFLGKKAGSVASSTITDITQGGTRCGSVPTGKPSVVVLEGQCQLNSRDSDTFAVVYFFFADNDGDIIFQEDVCRLNGLDIVGVVGKRVTQILHVPKTAETICMTREYIASLQSPAPDEIVDLNAYFYF